MSIPPEKPPEAARRSPGERPRTAHKMPVTGYLALLFGAAFLLLLLSYFMQQRSNSEAIAGLTQSVTAMKSIEQLQEENGSLQKQVEDLTAAAEALQAKTTELEAAHRIQEAKAEALRHQLEAMDYLRRIQQFYGAKAYRSARTVIEKFEALELTSFLPTHAVYQNEEQTVLSPAEEYQRIYDALY